jgi:hypothetical protein
MNNPAKETKTTQIKYQARPAIKTPFGTIVAQELDEDIVLSALAGNLFSTNVYRTTPNEIIRVSGKDQTELGNDIYLEHKESVMPTTIDQFSVLIDFVRETRDLQQKYLETIRTDNTVLIERYHKESIDLIDKVENRLEKTTNKISDNLTTFQNNTTVELGNVRTWYASTIIAILLTGLVGCGAIVLSIIWTAK